MQINIKFQLCVEAHKFLRYSVHKILETYIQTDRLFLKMIKSCSGHLKTCKSIENWMSKIFANPILFSFIYNKIKSDFLKKKSRQKQSGEKKKAMIRHLEYKGSLKKTLRCFLWHKNKCQWHFKIITRPCQFKRFQWFIWI